MSSLQATSSAAHESCNTTINGGGIPKKNDLLNQVYANVLQKLILVPQGDVTSLGSAIFAFLSAGAFSSIQEAQQALVPEHRVYEPQVETAAVYDELFDLYKRLYFAFGKKNSGAVELGDVLPALRRIASEARH
jgi:L-ribulokinase